MTKSNETRKIIREINKIIDIATSKHLTGVSFDTEIIPFNRMKEFADKFADLDYMVALDNRVHIGW